MKKLSTLTYLVKAINSELLHLQNHTLEEVDSEQPQESHSEQFAPPERSVMAIINYARSLEVFESKNVGTTEWILN